MYIEQTIGSWASTKQTSTHPLAKDQIWRIPQNVRSIQVVSGTAWIISGDEDLELSAGQTMIVGCDGAHGWVSAVDAKQNGALTIRAFVDESYKAANQPIDFVSRLRKMWRTKAG